MRLFTKSFIFNDLSNNFKLLACLSGNGRHLLTKEGKPFFWMGDMGWELFHRLDREEVNNI
ncbi:MAG: DUF4038 domain-containing protein [Bacteroidales bacterium]